MRPKFMISIIAFILSSAAWAQDSEESLALDTIRVQEEQDQSSVVSGQYLEDKQVRDLRDAFKDNPEVAVGGAQRAAQKIYVRGLEDTNLNVTVDGARQAGYIFHHQTRLNVDPELLKQVEVEAGTGNALAGPGALGGALRFVTKDAEDILLPGEAWGSLVKGWVHTNSEIGGALAIYGKPSERLSTLGYLTLTKAEDYKAGGGDRVDYSAGRPKSALAKLTYKPNLNHKYTLGANFTSDNATRLTRANFGNSPGAATMNRRFETLNSTMNYSYSPTNGAHTLSVDAYFANNELENKGAANATFDSYGVTVSDIFKFSRVKLTFGADANRDEANAKNQNGTGEEIGTIYGIFAQGHLEVTERFGVGAGLRYDDYKLETIGGKRFSDSHVSPNAEVSYQWAKAWQSKLSWSQAFRGPVPTEVFLLANAKTVAPVSHLKGTLAETIQLSNRFNLESQKAKIGITAYSTVLNDPLESGVDRNTGEVKRQNLKEDLKVRGAEVNISKNFGDVEGNLFYTHSETKFGKEHIGYSGNFSRGVSLGDRIGANIEWRIPERSLHIRWNSTVTMKLSNVPNGAKAQPGYDTHDISATWFANERLKANFAIGNIFDKKYIAQGSWYANASGQESALYEPGRNIKLAVSYQF